MSLLKPGVLARRHTHAPGSSFSKEQKKLESALSSSFAGQVSCIGCAAPSKVLCYTCNQGGDASGWCLACNSSIHKGDATLCGWGPSEHFRTRVSYKEGELFPDEDRRTEYKSVAKHAAGVIDLVKLKCEKLINGFLNAEGGNIYFGVDEKKVNVSVSANENEKKGEKTKPKLLHPVEHIVYDRNMREDIRMVVEKKVVQFYPGVSSELYQVVFTPIECSGASGCDPSTCEAHLLSIHVRRGSHQLYAVRKPLHFAEICQAYERKDSSTYQLSTQAVMARLGSKAVPGPLNNGYANDIAKLKTMPDGSIRHRGWLVELLNDFVKGNDSTHETENKADRRAREKKGSHRRMARGGGRVLMLVGDPGQGKTLFCSNCILNSKSWSKWRYRAEESYEQRDYVRYFQNLDKQSRWRSASQKKQEARSKAAALDRSARRKKEREATKRRKEEKGVAEGAGKEKEEKQVDVARLASTYEHNRNPDVDKNEFLENERGTPEFEVLGYHFVVANDSRTSDPGVFVRSLAALIVTSSLKHASHALNGPECEEALSEDRAMRDPESSLERGVLAPLRQCNPGSKTRYVVFVDGLNEASDTGEALSIVELLHRARVADKIPWWLTFVCTSTLDDRVQRWAGSFTVLKLDPESAETQEDLRSYIHARLMEELPATKSNSSSPSSSSAADAESREAVCDVLLQSSAGNFLYATLMLDAIRDGRLQTDEDSLRSIPPGVNSLYFGMFKSLFRSQAAQGVDFQTHIRPIFEVILASYTPLSEEDIERATKCSKYMSVIRHYLHEQLRDESEKQNVVYHRTHPSRNAQRAMSASQRRRLSSTGSIHNSSNNSSTPSASRGRNPSADSRTPGGVNYQAGHRLQDADAKENGVPLPLRAAASPTLSFSSSALLLPSSPGHSRRDVPRADSFGGNKSAEGQPRSRTGSSSIASRRAVSPTPSEGNCNWNALCDTQWAVEYSLFHQSLAAWLVSEDAGEFRCVVQRGHLALASMSLRAVFGAHCEGAEQRNDFEQELKKWGYDWYTPINQATGYGEGRLTESSLAGVSAEQSDESAGLISPFCVADVACHLADCSHGSMFLRSRLLQQAFRDLQDARDDQNKSALFVVCAMQVENVVAVELLMNAGLDPNARTTDGLTPLSIASRRGFLHAIQVLLTDTRTDVDSVSLKLHTPLHIAVRKGHLDVVRMLVAARADVNARTKYLHTCLHVAVEVGSVKIVSMLLGAKADYSKLNRNGQTPLCTAASIGDRAVLLELLQQEKVSVAAALRRPGRDGLTPLGVAVSEYRGPSEADELKDVHVFQALLAHGADYRLNDHCNRRVFYLACASGKTEIVKRLVEHHIATSSNPESKGNRSRSPRKHIHKAEGDSLEVFLNEAAFTHWKALKKSKLNPNTYKTPVFAAAVNMQLGVLKALVDISMRHGVFLDVNGAETRIRRTPLMDACFSLGRPELAACLLAHPECDPNLAEDDGGTALSDACFAGNVECVALLIQHNVDAHIVDKGGLAALHFACGRGQVKVAKLMLAYHARTNDVWCKKTFSTLHILEEVAAKVARADSLHSDAFAEYKLAFPTAQPPPKHAKTVSNPKLKPVLKALCVDQVTRGLGPEQYLVNLAEIHTACRALECMVESRRLSCAAAAVGGPPVMDRQLLGHSGMRAPPPRHLPQWLVRQQRQRQSKDAKKEP